ncbi:hypothetical protein AZA_03291 [Nitrospirillum viridazoti Y2]|nr:hypothetical protein AZA_03291 [Nitrospirillum amazonense Y2]
MVCTAQTPPPARRWCGQHPSGDARLAKAEGASPGRGCCCPGAHLCYQNATRVSSRPSYARW